MLIFYQFRLIYAATLQLVSLCPHPPGRGQLSNADLPPSLSLVTSSIVLILAPRAHKPGVAATRSSMSAIDI
jgi:hypothetical protein